MARTVNDQVLSGKISLRPASASDGDFLFQVYASTRQEEVAAWGWSPAQQSSFLGMQYEIRKRGYTTSYPSAETSIVLVGDTPAGSMIIFRTSGEIRVVDIALLPEFRNRGIGESLVRTLISEAGRSGSTMRLSVLRGNRAAQLYARLGFVMTGGDEMYCEMECVPGKL